ncbi:outer membrane lipoprotein carrier protein LolA [Arthrobacter sp. NA-172]|uniref:LolA family protein n=1 Tax=Arthrobacter sp. NA-172 TaxID=3367524 RepID=UPI0037547CA6
MTRTWLRWLPAAVVPVAIAAAALAGSSQAGAATSLPDKTAAEVIAMIGRADVHSMSGTLQQNSDLGLPKLPSTGSTATQGPASIMELLSGSHTARVYVDGPTKARFQVMDMLAERDLVRNGNDLWLYNSADNSAAHMTLPAEPTSSSKSHPSATPGMTTPDALAQHFLAAVGPSTEVTVGDGTTLAGHSAYQLVIKPRSTGTLVDSVTIAVDSASGLPLGVDVRARGQAAPAFSLAFSDVNLSTPDAALFSFTPPHGAAVEEKATPQLHALPGKASPTPSAKTEAGRPTVTGSGWDAVISFPAGTVPADVRTGSNSAMGPMLAQLTQALPGGRALTTSLVTVLMLDDGRVFAGMVPLERLQAAAAPQ